MPTSAPPPVVPGGNNSAATIAAANAGSVAAAAAANAKNSVTVPSSSTSSTAAPLLTTSSASRATTANNVATLNNAVQNAAVSNSYASNASGPASPSNPVASQQPGGASDNLNAPATTTTAPASTSTTTAPAATTSTPAATYTPPAGATQTTLPNGATGYYNQSNDTMTDANGNPLTYSQQAGGWIDPTTGGAPVAGSSSSSSTSGGAAPGATESPASIAAAVSSSGLSPSMQTLYQSTLTQQANEQAQAFATLQSAQATLANDPAATQAINAIYAQYQTLIDQMNQKNQQVLGKASASVGAFGGLGVMSQGFLSDEADDASQRIATLVSEQNSAVLAAQASYGKEDLDAFNTAMDNYNKTIDSMNTALSDLSDAVDKQVTEQQAQQRLDLDTQTAQVTNDGKIATANAGQIASALTAQGVDLGSYDYSSLAQTLGISDPTTLGSAVIAAQQASAKADLDTANTQDEMQDRDITTADSQATTAATIQKDAFDEANTKTTPADFYSYANNLVTGTNPATGKPYTDGSGVPYADSNGFITPSGWKNLLSLATTNGVSQADLFSEYSNKLYASKADSYQLTPEQITELDPN